MNPLDLLNFLTKVLIISFLIFISIVVFKNLKTEGYAIQPFQVPKSLSDGGYTGLVIANRIQDEIVANHKGFLNKKDDLAISSNSKPDLNVEVLGVGLSASTISYHLRDLLGIESKFISGELTDLDNEYRLTLRITGSPTSYLKESYKDDKNAPDALDRIVTKTCEKSLLYTDPYRLTVSLYKQERVEEAMQIVRDLIETQHEDRKWAYLFWAYHERISNPKKSEELINKALELDPNFIDALRTKGWNLLNVDKPKEALNYFTKAQEIDSEDQAINFGIARCHTLLGELEKAEQAYKRNIKSNGDNMWAYNNYASFKKEYQADTLGAVDIYKQAGKNIGKNSGYYFSIAGTHLMMNDLDSALVYLEKTLDYNPKHTSALLGITQIYTLEKYENLPAAEKYAKQTLDILIKNNYDDGMIQTTYNRLAIISYKQNKLDSAMVQIRKAIDINPKDPFPWSTLAEIYYYKKDMDSFYKYLEKSLKLGVNIEPWEDDEPYSLIKHESRYLELKSNYQKLKN